MEYMKRLGRLEGLALRDPRNVWKSCSSLQNIGYYMSQDDRPHRNSFSKGKPWVFAGLQHACSKAAHVQLNLLHQRSNKHGARSRICCSLVWTGDLWCEWQVASSILCWHAPEWPHLCNLTRAKAAKGFDHCGRWMALGLKRVVHLFIAVDQPQPMDRPRPDLFSKRLSAFFRWCCCTCLHWPTWCGVSPLCCPQYQEPKLNGRSSLCQFQCANVFEMLKTFSKPSQDSLVELPLEAWQQNRTTFHKKCGSA